MASDNENLELAFALKHIEQHLLQNDSNTKKIGKLHQRIIQKEKLISCKGATKIYQTYEGLIQDIQNNLNTIDHVLRLCGISENEQDKLSSDVEDIPVEDTNDNSAPASILPVESLVAALTLTAEGSEEWILARIKHFDGTSYVVEDTEAEEEGSIEISQREIYTVDPNHMITIPESVEIALTRPEFRLKQNVLALFPGTTCFYSSIVMSQPSRRKKTRDYLLKFSDDDVSSRPCSARYVLPFPINK